MQLPDGIRREVAPSGLDVLRLEHDAASAEVFLLGATVTSFVPRGQASVLWLSPTSTFSAGKAIRGGIPICFPWFGPKAGAPEAPQHGFVRSEPWELEAARARADALEVTLLKRSDRARAHYPHGLEARLVVSVGPALEVALEVTALDALVFEAALHTYLHVGDVRRAELSGLEGASCFDKVVGAARAGEAGPLVLAGPTDRVYEGHAGALAVWDPVLGRRLRVEKQGARSTVVWNPWDAKAWTMPDMGGDDAWSRMVCVETANVRSDAVTLGAGERHRMATTVAVS